MKKLKVTNYKFIAGYEYLYFINLQILSEDFFDENEKDNAIGEL